MFVLNLIIVSGVCVDGRVARGDFSKTPRGVDPGLVMLNYHGAEFLCCLGGDFFLPRGGAGVSDAHQD